MLSSAALGAEVSLVKAEPTLPNPGEGNFLLQDEDDFLVLDEDGVFIESDGG